MASRSQQAPSKNVTLTVELVDLIKAWAEHSGKPDSEVVRIALGYGFKALSENPNLLPPKVDTSGLQPPKKPKKKRR